MRAFVVKVTWPKEAKCDVKKIAIRCGDNIEPTPEAACAYVKSSCHHKRGMKYFWPLTAEIDAEVSPDALPQPIAIRKTAPAPLAAAPKPLES